MAVIMLQTTLQTLFSRICGQDRCFEIDGMELVVCQRCLGLYAAVAITGTCLLVAGVWRRGLPGRCVMLLHAGMLLMAMLGGLHVIDAGPTWRLVCGLWTGHVVAIWLMAGSFVLHGRTTQGGLPLRRLNSFNDDRQRIWVSFMSPILYVLAAIVFVGVQPPGWWIWSGIACAGAVIIIVAVPVAGAMMVIRLFR